LKSTWSQRETADLGGPQAVPEGNQDHGGVAVTIAIALGGLDQTFETAKRMYPGDVIEPSPSSPPSSPANADATASPRRHVLPKDLPGAIKQLDDQELDRLLAAVLAEQKRRARKLPVSVETPDKPRIDAAVLHLTPGKRNAVRAAFKAGVRPSQIARQFGLSQSDVRKALASDSSKRAPLEPTHPASAGGSFLRRALAAVPTFRNDR
jgi:hypothetical protein